MLYQHPQRRHQNPLRLFHPHRPTAPALPQRPFADRAPMTGYPDVLTFVSRRPVDPLLKEGHDLATDLVLEMFGSHPLGENE
jgi:hypothetical protein